MSETATETQETITQSTENQSTETKSEPITEIAKDTSTDQVVAPKLPESYDLKLPQNSVLNGDAVERIASFAKEQGLTQVQAQKHLEREDSMIKDLQSAQDAHVEKTATAWLEDAKADEELGGDKFNRTVEISKRVIERFGSEVLREQLDTSGLGNHPELLRMLFRIGASMSEDQFIRGSRPVNAPPKSTADVLYGETS